MEKLAGGAMIKGLIYCVDDDTDILNLYQVILSQEGHEVLKIANGEKALKAFRQKEPDLIILDERLDDMTGMEICGKIRNVDHGTYIPIIMVTGVDSKEGKINSLESGIDDYILKPFDHEELLAKVQVMLRIKRLYTDLVNTRQELVKAEKLAAVGQLAAAMAHEIRNPLSIIGATVQFLRNKLAEQEETRGMMDTILRKISEIDGTVRELLAVARPLKLKRTELKLNHCVQEVVGFIREKCLAHRVQLQLKLDPDEPVILGDMEHLQRVFLNIFINALNSMPQGGELKIELEGDENQETVVITDTGEGMRPEAIPHIFEPFFTQKPGGSGLGLFVVKMIVDELNGRIQVESIPNIGSTFRVSFPQLKDKKVLKSMVEIPDTLVN